MKKQRTVPEVGIIPECKEKYWYIQSNMVTHSFGVRDTEWIGGFSDTLRLAKGNLYMKEEEANRVCALLNERHREICDFVEEERETRRIAEEAEHRRKSEERRKKELTKKN